ncbi:3-isopropylmalate dehydratase, small subunit [Agrilactobacillus composti DSM 18527 = JCM 14202]|uniref:3-isopropylmalate dehydratase small subunit n=1 Tax=Agrilactobacillus composti DSM 18527 = JCM 14202 TaxID=1423734 RepID=X0PF69_9LACO|nr:3-isopropylmalate dehydratase small subunit [Agrilactobacillus composti]KRM33246.1 3-isopropylmalate dehydratase, small subunit [Agrilactobacillus composti DSM 18527 = JCM 14202]GAF40318.1 3-isopropylmalate dehydratase small subunit [Agrilactobacillus composti DSM 18527 = JCM 14202]
MEKFTVFEGKPAVIMRNDIDTDQLIPKQFLKNILKTGYGISLFYDWRYDENGKPRPDFILNKPEYKDATILVAGTNFGSGSSREHAAWALTDFGFKTVIAEGFGPIFYMNATKNGLLPIKLSHDDVQFIGQATDQDRIKIDLPQQTVTFRGKAFHFDFEEMYRYKFINGLDDIDITLQHEAEITQFENKLPDFAANNPGDMSKSELEKV